MPRSMSAPLVRLAIQHKIRLGRTTESGYYFAADRTGRMVAVSMQPTAQSGMVMLKKLIKNGGLVCWQGELVSVIAGN